MKNGKITLVLCVAAGVTMGVTASQFPANADNPTTNRPNVLLIVSEDNSPDLSCYGNSFVQTPNLDRLAAQGVRFERAFVATASCSESRSAILTGLYPHQNGQIGLATHKYSMHRHWPSLPSLLKQQGYRTGIIGKLHVNPKSAFPFDFQWNQAAFCSFSHRDVRKIADVADGFITESDQPFFLMVNYPDAHLPWLPQQQDLPETPLTANDVKTLPFVGVDVPRLRACTADYYNCMSRLDSGIGMLLKKLALAGHERDTLVIYLSDHGAQFQRGKLSCYEGGLRVPLIVRWPGRAKAGLVSDRLVGTVDLLPTILEAVGAEVPAGLAGRSMEPLFRGDAATWREYLFAEYHSHYPPIYFPQRTVRDGRFKLIVNLLQDRPNPVAQPKEPVVTRLPSYVTSSDLAGATDAVRRGYGTWKDAPPVELYDLENDPYEFENLAGQSAFADVEKRLLTQLDLWRRQTGDPLIDPAKLAKLTSEQDQQAEKYKQGSRSGGWKYHQYLYGKLAENGKALLSIRVGTEATGRTRAAATTLADYLGRMAGAEFAVGEGDGAEGIVVGLPDDFAQLPFDIAFEDGAFGREEYLLRSTPSGLYLLGASELAVEHAVWDTLYRLGYRQFFPGETWEIVPRREDLWLTVDALEKPDFFARRIWYNWGLWDYNRKPYRDWCARNRNVQGFRLNSGHSYGGYIRENKAAFDEHPEYFALVDGKRTVGAQSKFCISNPGLRKLIVDTAVRRFQKNPGLDSISVDPSDGAGWCDCEQCARMGSVSDRALTLANEVAAAINDLGLGDKHVGMYAYNKHCPPPSVKVHPNVIISVTTAFLTGGWTFDQVVQGWAGQGATLGVYDYFSVIAWDWNMPRRSKAAYAKDLAAAIRSYHDTGARFLDAESGDAWGPYGLGYYVASRVMWDVDEADRVDEIVNDFLEKCFGRAAEPMAKFYELIGEDRTRRSTTDILARMYRRLDEARELARDDPQVMARLDDLVLYTRYAELYDAYARTVGGGKEKARDAMLTHAYRMRKRMMVHVYGLFARTVGQKAAHDPDCPLKSEDAFTDDEIARFVSEGMTNNKPVEIDFEPLAFSEDLVPATGRLGLPDVPPGKYPSVPQDRQNYYIWVDKAPADIHLRVTVQRVWDLRPHKISLFSSKDVNIEAVDVSGIVKPDGKTYDVVLKTPYDGLHRIESRDGGDHTRFVWPEAVAVTIPSGMDTVGISNHFRGDWTLYCYVPEGTKVFGGWSARIAQWAPPVSGTLQNAAGEVMIDFGKIDPGWFSCPVPKGQDGQLWKFVRCQGVRQLCTIPPYLAITGQDLLLPKEIVEEDAKD